MRVVADMKRFHLWLVVAVLSLVPGLVSAASEGWVIGKWELVYDPDGARKDWLEFAANGDAVNIWPDGERVPGMYIVTPQGVKAVFTHQGRDVIATFFFDAHAGVLKIVTSRTGQASLYRKLH